MCVGLLYVGIGWGLGLVWLVMIFFFRMCGSLFSVGCYGTVLCMDVDALGGNFSWLVLVEVN